MNPKIRNQNKKIDTNGSIAEDHSVKQFTNPCGNIEDICWDDNEAKYEITMTRKIPVKWNYFLLLSISKILNIWILQIITMKEVDITKVQESLEWIEAPNR